MNPSQQTSYQCPECSYVNHWTRDEIIQRGEEVILRGEYVYYKYSLPCRNPALRCREPYVVKVPRWEE